VRLLSSEIDPGVNKCVAEYVETKASLAIMFKASSHFEKRQFTRAEGGHKPQMESSTPKSLTAPLNIPRVYIWCAVFIYVADAYYIVRLWIVEPSRK